MRDRHQRQEHAGAATIHRRDFARERFARVRVERHAPRAPSRIPRWLARPA